MLLLKFSRFPKIKWSMGIQRFLNYIILCNKIFKNCQRPKRFFRHFTQTSSFHVWQYINTVITNLWHFTSVCIWQLLKHSLPHILIYFTPVFWDFSQEKYKIISAKVSFLYFSQNRNFHITNIFYMLLLLQNIIFLQMTTFPSQRLKVLDWENFRKTQDVTHSHIPVYFHATIINCYPPLFLSRKYYNSTTFQINSRPQNIFPKTLKCGLTKDENFQGTVSAQKSQNGSSFGSCIHKFSHIIQRPS